MLQKVGSRRMPKNDRSIEAIGERLMLSRQVTGKTQGEYSAAAKIPQNTYNQYERGKARPTVDHANAICDVHKITLDGIYRGDPSGLQPDMLAAIKALRAHRRA
jgi:DNA-binding XRE family transcriptional regulator